MVAVRLAWCRIGLIAPIHRREYNSSVMAERLLKTPITIPREELVIRYQTSSGPGGQTVNKTATRAVVQFDVVTTRILSDEQRRMVCKNLANRINAEGWLTVECEETRSQATNRKRAMERLTELLRQATIPPKKRRPTRPGSAAIQRRLTDKARRSKVKQQRSGRSDE